VLVHRGQELASAALGAEPHFGGSVVGLESQLGLAGIRPRRFRQVDDDLDLVETARFGEQPGELQSSQGTSTRR
jgi:hypothetical protein